LIPHKSQFQRKCGFFNRPIIAGCECDGGCEVEIKRALSLRKTTPGSRFATRLKLRERCGFAPGVF